MFKFPIKTWSNQLNPLKYMENRKKHLKNVLLNPLLVTLWPLFFGPPASPPPEGRPSWNGTRRSPQSENDRKIPKNVMVLYLHVPISQKIDSRSSSYRSFAISSLFFPIKSGLFYHHSRLENAGDDFHDGLAEDQSQGQGDRGHHQPGEGVVLGMGLENIGDIYAMYFKEMSMYIMIINIYIYIDDQQCLVIPQYHEPTIIKK